MSDVATSQPDLTCDECWRAVSKSQFMVLSYVNEQGEPRSSGVLFGVARPHLGVIVKSESWKARCIKTGQVVSVTVPVRRGGILSLFMPIPPATVNFHARAIVHEPGTLDDKSLVAFAPYHPDSIRKIATVIELVPEGRFMTYGISVPLTAMTKPEVALRHAPIS
jgi:hypothetical protein